MHLSAVFRNPIHSLPATTLRFGSLAETAGPLLTHVAPAELQAIRPNVLIGQLAPGGYTEFVRQLGPRSIELTFFAGGKRLSHTGARAQEHFFDPTRNGTRSIRDLTRRTPGVPSGLEGKDKDAVAYSFVLEVTEAQAARAKAAMIQDRGVIPGELTKDNNCTVASTRVLAEALPELNLPVTGDPFHLYSHLFWKTPELKALLVHSPSGAPVVKKGFWPVVVSRTDDVPAPFHSAASMRIGRELIRARRAGVPELLAMAHVMNSIREGAFNQSSFQPG